MTSRAEIEPHRTIQPTHGRSGDRMSGIEVKNAVIDHATITNDDHGLLSAWIGLDYGGSGQGFGGYALYLPKDFKHHGGPNFALWREPDTTGNGDFYSDSVHVTASGGIGINCAGHVIVMPLRKWHELASAAPVVTQGAEHTCHDMNPPFQGPCRACEIKGPAGGARKDAMAQSEQSTGTFQSAAQPSGWRDIAATRVLIEQINALLNRESIGKLHKARPNSQSPEWREFMRKREALLIATGDWLREHPLPPVAQTPQETP